LQLATLVQMTLPGAPCIYYGDEVGMDGRHDPDSRRAFAWDEAVWDRQLRDFVRSVVGLRRRERVLRDGEYRTLLAFGGVVAYGRLDAQKSAVVVLNVGQSEARVSLSESGIGDARLEPVELPGMAALRVEPGPLLIIPPRTGGVLLSRR